MNFKNSLKISKILKNSKSRKNQKILTISRFAKLIPQFMNIFKNTNLNDKNLCKVWPFYHPIPGSSCLNLGTEPLEHALEARCYAWLLGYLVTVLQSFTINFYCFPQGKAVNKRAL